LAGIIKNSQMNLRQHLSILFTIIFISCTGGIMVEDRVGSYVDHNLEPSIKSGYKNIKSLKEVWRKRYISGISEKITISKNTAIISFLNGEVASIRIADGTQIGRRKMGKGPAIDLKLMGENIYFALPRERKQLRSYNILKGNFNWRRRLAGGANAIALDSLYLFVSTKDGIITLNQTNGSTVWEKNEVHTIGSSLLSIGTQLIYSDLRGNVICRDIRSGDLFWKTLVSSSILYAEPLALGEIFIGTTASGLVFAMSLIDGTITWDNFFSEPIYTSPIIKDDKVIVALSSGELKALQLKDGQEIWTFKTGQLLSQPILITNTHFILTTTQRGDIYIVDTHNGNIIWHQKIDARIMVEPSLSDNIILISDDQKYITAYEIIPTEETVSN
tara:strand:- start:526 stop:1689 length:1164 start_codon:yes stop_codon:yes gene_type:complete